MYTFEDLGRPLTHQKLVPGNTATGLSAYCYKYSIYRLNFDAGTADNALAVGNWIVGATSGAVGRILYLSDITGSWAGNNAAGYVLIDSWNGTAWTDDEKIKMGSDATMADVNQAAAIVEATEAEYNLCKRFQLKGNVAKSALVVVYANTALVGLDADKPDQTALIGIPMVANSSVLLRTAEAMAGFKCIDYTASSASIVQVRFYF